MKKRRVYINWGIEIEENIKKGWEPLGRPFQNDKDYV